MKKSYCKPELKTRALELGVFGDYANGRGSTSPVEPSAVIANLRIRME